ncbi:MAG: PEGA domain-containing protein [Paludibacteraceae bacterium]|nr:PEGA domain-containing protein [Paludibacteraceae bacterium]
MASGFSKRMVGLCMLLAAMSLSAQYKVKVSDLAYDIQDLSQRNTKIVDQNGERCALIKFETPIPSFFLFQLGAQQIEKREDKDDEIWIWVSPDVKKMTIHCSDCSPLKDYRVSLKGGNVYRAKITTGLPQEVATTQHVNIYCERTPFFISIDGAAPIENASRTFNTELSIGAHNINVSAKLSKPYRGTIRVYRSKPYMDTIRLDDYYGEIVVNASQSSYTLYVDDELRKQNRTVRVEPGAHKVTLIKDRYETIEQTVEVEEGKQTILPIEFKPVFSIFNVICADEETEIWLDGVYKGRNRANIEIVWGEHQLEGRRQGYDPFVLPVKDFTAESEKTIKIPKLNKQFGALRVSVYPPDAQLYVDGQEATLNDGVYRESRITTGIHFIQCRKADYASIRDSVEVTVGQLSARDYTLEALPMGWLAIRTDPEVAIYVITPGEDKPSYLGHSSIYAHLPAGENIIELRNKENIHCRYHVFINNKQDITEPVTMPFRRQLMIRSNVLGADVVLRDSLKYGEHVKANTKMKLNPVRYSLAMEKKGYETYRDTIDLSDPNTPSLVYYAKMRKKGDTTVVDSTKRTYQSPKVFHAFYDNAGKWYIGIFNLGYSFDFNGGGKYLHQIHFGILPIRYRIVQLNPADFEMTIGNGLIKNNISYRPKLSAVLPCNKSLAFTFYLGADVNLNDLAQKKSDPRTYLLSGASMRINHSGRFPVDIFAEYTWPVKGVDKSLITHKEQLFRVGLSFSTGIDF